MSASVAPPARNAAVALAPSGQDGVPPKRLARTLGAFQFFTLALGAVVGAGWAVVLGDWLRQAGPIGAIAGLASGGLAIVVIGVCYAEVAAVLPVTGGEIAYAYETFGQRTCFLMGWLLAFTYLIVAAFEAISIGWILSALLPPLEGPVLYHILGGDVRLGALALGLGGMAVLTYLNYRGARSASYLQDALIVALLVTALVFIGAGVVRGHAANLVPYFQRTPSGSFWPGVLGLFATASFWFGGFNVVPQAMEERSSRTSLRRVGAMIVLSIVVGVVFKTLVVFSASMSAPWHTLTAASVPVVAAFESALGPVLARVVLLTALFGLLSTWNAVLLAGTRVLFAMGRAGLLPRGFGLVHHGSPVAAVLFSGLLGGAATLLGRNAIVAIVDASATALVVGYLVTCLALIRLRRTRPDALRPFRVPGGVSTAWVGAGVAAFSLVLSLYEPYQSAGGAIPLEWKFLGVWLALGAFFWMVAGPYRATIPEAERRAIIVGTGRGDA